MLIFCYADWCGHCQKFKPTWNGFKSKYAPVLDIRELNADQDKQEIGNLGVRGFPSVMLLNNGKRTNFEGPRTMAGLEQFVKTNLNTHLNDNLKNYRNMKN
jgi:thioredoxin-like negative regulator of GroEL